MIDQHASLAEKFLKKGFWLYLFSFIMAPIWYIIKIIISGELSVDEVGILYWIISLITLLCAYNDFGVTESLNHFIPKFITEKRYDKVKSIIVYSFILQGITSILLTAFFFFGADIIAQHYLKNTAAVEALKIFSLFFIGINIFQIFWNFFLSVQNTFYSKLADLIRLFCVLLFTLYILFSDSSHLLYYSYAWIIGLYIGVVFSFTVFLNKYYKKYLKGVSVIWDRVLIKEVLSYAFYVFLWIQAATILGQIDMQMIIYMLGTTSAGYYTNYLSIISIPFMLIWPIFGLLFPIFSELHAKNEHSKITLIKQMFAQNFVHIAIAVNILLFIFSEIIAVILFGEKFFTSWVILKYSVLFLMFNFLLQINFNILAWIWQVQKRVKIISIAIIFNIITNIIFIKWIWIYGAALATWFGWILIWILSEIYLWKTYRTTYNFGALLKNIVTFSIIWGLLYYYILPYFDMFGRMQQFFLLLILTIIYCIFFFIFNKKDFSFLIREVKQLRRWK